MNFSAFEIVKKLARESGEDQHLTIEQRELLVCLFEEAAEVVQIVAKILRFGYASSNPFTGHSNANLLHTEIGDFFGIVDRLTELDLLSMDQIGEAAEAKLAKLENYLLYKGDTNLAEPVEELSPETISWLVRDLDSGNREDEHE